MSELTSFGAHEYRRDDSGNVRIKAYDGEVVMDRADLRDISRWIRGEEADAEATAIKEHEALVDRVASCIAKASTGVPHPVGWYDTAECLRVTARAVMALFGDEFFPMLEAAERYHALESAFLEAARKRALAD